MNPMGLMELGQIKEQEHMREALRRAALRDARRQAGITWTQMVRAWLFRQRDGVTPSAPAAAPAPPATPATALPASSGAPATGTPVLVHEIRIRQHAGHTRTAARASASAPQLRVVGTAERECVGADC